MSEPARSHRILFVVNEAAFFVSHRLPLALAAQKNGYDVHVATPSGPGEEIIRSTGLSFHPVPLDRRSLNPLSGLGTIVSLVRLFRRLKPDLIHTVTIKPVIYGGIAA